MPKSAMKALEEDPMGHLSHRMQSPELLEEGTLPVPKSAKGVWDRSLMQQRRATRKTPRASPRKATPASPERDTIARPQKAIPVGTLGHPSTSKQGHPIQSKGHPSCTLGHPCIHTNTPRSVHRRTQLDHTSHQQVHRKGTQQSDRHCTLANSRPLDEGTLPVPPVCLRGSWSDHQKSYAEAPSNLITAADQWTQGSWRGVCCQYLPRGSLSEPTWQAGQRTTWHGHADAHPWRPGRTPATVGHSGWVTWRDSLPNSSHTPSPTKTRSLAYGWAISPLLLEPCGFERRTPGHRSSASNPELPQPSHDSSLWAMKCPSRP